VSAAIVYTFPHNKQGAIFLPCIVIELNSGKVLWRSAFILKMYSNILLYINIYFIYRIEEALFAVCAISLWPCERSN
jgi:preprotein translocase subunit SecF